MKYEPSGLETLTLWHLAVNGGGDWKGDVKPALKGPSWSRLAGAGLVEEEKRSPPAGGRKRLYVSLADPGWLWLSERLGAPIATRSPAALEILVRLLARLGAHLGQSGLALAEFIQARPAGAADDRGGAEAADVLDRKVEADHDRGVLDRKVEADNVRDGVDADNDRGGLDRRVEAACLSLGDGRPNARVRLADLREALSGTAREALDAVLLDMAASGRASLYRLDDPREIGPRDRDAVLRTPSGEERHIVYLGGRGS